MKTFHQKGSTVIFLALILVIGGIGIFYYIDYVSEDQSPDTAIPTQNLHKGWKLYINEQYGYELLYPKELVVASENQRIVHFTPTNSPDSDSGGGLSVEILENTQNYSLNEWCKSAQETEYFCNILSRPDPAFETISTFILNNLEITTIEVKPRDNSDFFGGTLYLFIQNGKLYVISDGYLTSDDSKAMLASFKLR